MSGILSSQRRAVGIWLLICTLVVYFMIMIGGITRLTQSGLSMVEWEPIMGIIPPLNEHDWLESFEKYKAFPEYQKVNKGMSLQEYKGIFLWEYGHRVLGRFIGILFLLPYLFFLFRGYLPGKWKWKLLTAFALGGLQGLMGWYMVKSGLVDNPAVSHFRLAAHLSLAFVIYALMFWVALTFKKQEHSGLPNPDRCVFRFGLVALFVLCLTICWGAFTAGLDAGLVYNDSFPKMGDTWVPEEVWLHSSVWMSLIENHAGVQFVHRWLAILTMVVILSFVFYSMSKGRKDTCFAALGIFVFVQVGLGIVTLLSGVHLHVAVAHQAGAVILLTLIIMCLHNSFYKSEP